MGSLQTLILSLHLFSSCHPLQPVTSHLSIKKRGDKAVRWTFADSHSRNCQNKHLRKWRKKPPTKVLKKHLRGSERRNPDVRFGKMLSIEPSTISQIRVCPKTGTILLWWNTQLGDLDDKDNKRMCKVVLNVLWKELQDAIIILAGAPFFKYFNSGLQRRGKDQMKELKFNWVSFCVSSCFLSNPINLNTAFDWRHLQALRLILHQRRGFHILARLWFVSRSQSFCCSGGTADGLIHSFNNSCKVSARFGIHCLQLWHSEGVCFDCYSKSLNSVLLFKWHVRVMSAGSAAAAGMNRNEYRPLQRHTCSDKQHFKSCFHS